MIGTLHNTLQKQLFTCISRQQHSHTLLPAPSNALLPRKLVSPARLQVLVQAAATEVTTVQLATEGSFAGTPFNWFTAWYPVYLEDDLDASRPHAITVLNKQLVLWKDGSTWRAFRDRCPHRLAALSEGRIEAGTLQCAYHGYRFDGSGSCTLVPHAKDEAAHEAAIASPRGCVETFPCKVLNGMIWVWPDSASTEEATTTPALGNEFTGEADRQVDGQITELLLFYREMPYDFETLLENVADPGHVPFSHHGVQGNRNKVKFGQFDMQPAEPALPNQLAVTLPSFAGPHARQRLTYDPPCRLQYTSQVPQKFGGGEFLFTIYCVPVCPGKSILIASQRTTSTFKGFKAAKLKPKWFDHATNRMEVLDGDSVFLHNQEQVLARELSQPNAPSWSRLYWLPTTADLLVSSLRQWMSDPTAGAGGPWGPDRYHNWPPATTDRHIILDRYQSHTKHCKACSTAFRNIGIAQQVAYAASLICTAAALMALVMLGYTGPQVAPVAPIHAVVLGVCGGLFAWVSVKLAAFRENYVFRDYIHQERN